MKKLLSIIIVISISISCKQPKNKLIKKETQQSNKILVDETHKFKKETINFFLKKLQQAIKEKNNIAIENKIKFPFEHKIGGEADIYNNYKELNQNCPEFIKILDAKFIKKEKNIYSTLYPENTQNKNIFYLIQFSDPNDMKYFIYYYAVREGNTFKLVCLETEP